MAQERNTMKDQFARLEELAREAGIDIDLNGIWLREYKAVMTAEIAREVRHQARTRAEADILDTRNAGKEVSD